MKICPDCATPNVMVKVTTWFPANGDRTLAISGPIEAPSTPGPEYWCLECKEHKIILRQVRTNDDT